MNLCNAIKINISNVLLTIQEASCCSRCGGARVAPANLCRRASRLSSSSSARSAARGRPSLRASTSRIWAFSSAARASIARRSTFIRNRWVRFTLRGLQLIQILRSIRVHHVYWYYLIFFIKKRKKEGRPRSLTTKKSECVQSTHLIKLQRAKT